MEKRIYKMEVYSKEVKTDKNTFLTHSTKINDKYYKLKFKKDCATTIVKKGVCTLVVDLNKISVQANATYVGKDGLNHEATPVIWVGEVEKIEPIPQEELDKRNLDRTVDVLFGADSQDMPF